MKDQYKVERPYALTDDDLKEHIRAVGRKIIEGADKMGLKACGIRSIDISASIAPAELVTTIDWNIEEYADPRISKGEQK